MSLVRATCRTPDLRPEDWVSSSLPDRHPAPEGPMFTSLLLP